MLVIIQTFKGKSLHGKLANKKQPHEKQPCDLLYIGTPIDYNKSTIKTLTIYKETKFFKEKRTHLTRN